MSTLVKEIRPWSSSDYGNYCQWFILRALKPPPAEALPATGFIVDNVAAGFLIKTDCKVAIIEHVATNPKSDGQDREKALNEIFNELQFVAKKSGFKYLFGNTLFKEIADRGERYGFQNIGKYDNFMKGI